MKASSLTVDILDTNSYYSQLKARTSLRWYEMKDKESEKRGRKINENFESEVWGKLMLCIFEKNIEDVSAVAYIITKCYYLLLGCISNNMKSNMLYVRSFLMIGRRESCSSSSKRYVLLRHKSLRCNCCKGNGSMEQ